jgi:hypothetical protein
MLNYDFQNEYEYELKLTVILNILLYINLQLIRC